MKILLTGGAGFIGSHTIIELDKAGYDVIVVDNLYNSNPKALDRVGQIIGKQIPFYKADIRDHEALTKIFDAERPDAVIHFAGLKAVGESVAKPLEYYHNNMTGTFILLDVMRNHNCKNIIFSSSATVYGDPVQIPITEQCPKGHCTNPYGQTKSMLEEVLMDVQKGDLVPLLFEKFPQPLPRAVQRHFHLPDRGSRPPGDGFHGVEIPVPAHEDGLPVRGERGEIPADRPTELLVLHPAGGVVRGGDAVFELRAQLDHHSPAFQAVPRPADVQGEIADDPREEGKEIVRRIVRGNAVPGFEVGVVLALLGGGTVFHDIPGDPPQPRAVFPGGLPDGVLVPGEVQRDDFPVFHCSASFPLFCIPISGFHLHKRYSAPEVTGICANFSGFFRRTKNRRETIAPRLLFSVTADSGPMLRAVRPRR